MAAMVCAGDQRLLSDRQIDKQRQSIVSSPHTMQESREDTEHTDTPG
jgi:hypothetical protein